jgi:hypothetical protein
MAPLIVLVMVTLVARLVGQFGPPAWRDWPAATLMSSKALPITAKGVLL